MGVTWLIIALVTWSLLALAVGLVIGRGISVSGGHLPRWSANALVRRELTSGVVAQESKTQDHETTRI